MSTQKQGESESEDEGEDEGMFTSGFEDNPETGDLPQTAMVGRAHRRNTKRFRLTHNQTRFLMAEFASQPNPNAAQRDRLSRGIPGLSSRQVQIWFQNRRAKLNRLSTPDREQMMKSRAVPQDFDRTSTLFPPISTPYQPKIGSIMQPPSGFTESMRDIDTAPDFGYSQAIREETSSSGVSSAYSEPMWTPGSVLGSHIHSPVSSADGRTKHTGSLVPHLHSSNVGNPYAQLQGFPTIYSTSTDPRSHIRAETLALQPPEAIIGAGHTRHSSLHTRDTFARHTNPALIDQFGQSHVRSPLLGMAGYSPPSGESSRTRWPSYVGPDSQLQRAQPTAYKSPDSRNSAHTMFDSTQHLDQLSVTYPMIQSDPPNRALSIPSSVYPWSASSEPNARAFPSVTNLNPHPSRASYIALEGATDDIESIEARQEFRDTTSANLGPPQHISTPRQGAGGMMRARAQDGDRESFPHPL